MNEHQMAHHGNVTIAGCQMECSALMVVTIINLHIIAAQHNVDLRMPAPSLPLDQSLCFSS